MSRAGQGSDDRLVGPVLFEYYAGTEGNGFVACGKLYKRLLRDRYWKAQSA